MHTIIRVITVVAIAGALVALATTQLPKTIKVEG